MLVGGLFLLWGLCDRRRGRVCLFGGGCLAVLGFLFTCTPQSWGLPLSGVLAVGTLFAVLLHKWVVSV